MKFRILLQRDQSQNLQVIERIHIIVILLSHWVIQLKEQLKWMALVVLEIQLNTKRQVSAEELELLQKMR